MIATDTVSERVNRPLDDQILLKTYAVQWQKRCVVESLQCCIASCVKRFPWSKWITLWIKRWWLVKLQIKREIGSNVYVTVCLLSRTLKSSYSPQSSTPAFQVAALRTYIILSKRFMGLKLGLKVHLHSSKMNAKSENIFLISAKT